MPLAFRYFLSKTRTKTNTNAFNHIFHDIYDTNVDIYVDPKFCADKNILFYFFQLYVAELCDRRCNRDDDKALMGVKWVDFFVIWSTYYMLHYTFVYTLYIIY